LNDFALKFNDLFLDIDLFAYSGVLRGTSGLVCGIVFVRRALRGDMKSIMACVIGTLVIVVSPKVSSNDHFMDAF
jgi:hypothetical protein